MESAVGREDLMTNTELNNLAAPFPYFGGKSKVRDEVWRRFGKVDRYVEPFFGSGAVMLANPYWQDTKEIVNDLNHFISNCWRSLRHDPEAVAYWCDYPTIEIETHLWHIWLVNEGIERIKACEWDAGHYDAEVAGKWLYGMANWIGSHYAAGTGCWTRESLKQAAESGTYNHREIVSALSGDGQGVNRQRPHLGDDGRGVNRKLPHLGNDGQGVNRKLPHLGNDGRGDESGTLFPKNEPLYQYIRRLSERLIEVDVCCGDWLRICKPAVTSAAKNSTVNNTAGIFFDPPYSTEAGRSSVYTHEDFSVAHAVRKWCVNESDNPRMRIALCGYDVEHKELEDYGFEPFTWSASGGYSGIGKKSAAGLANKHREVIWFSASCRSNEGRLF